MKTTAATQVATAAATMSALAGGTRDNMHFRSEMTQEQIGVGSPVTVSIGSDSYAGKVLELRRNREGKICYVKVTRDGMGTSHMIEFRLRKSGQLRSSGHGSYGLTLGFSENHRDPSF